MSWYYLPSLFCVANGWPLKLSQNVTPSLTFLISSIFSTLLVLKAASAQVLLTRFITFSYMAASLPSDGARAFFVSRGRSKCHMSVELACMNARMHEGIPLATWSSLAAPFTQARLEKAREATVSSWLNEKISGTCPKPFLLEGWVRNGLDEQRVFPPWRTVL